MTKILVAILSLLVVWFWQKNDPGTNPQAAVKKAKMDSASVVKIDQVKTVSLVKEIEMTDEMKHQSKTCVLIY